MTKEGEELTREIDERLLRAYRSLEGIKNRWYEVAFGQALQVWQLESKLSAMRDERYLVAMWGLSYSGRRQLSVEEGGGWREPTPQEIQNDVTKYLQALDQKAEPKGKERPKVVCLCGSTRFWREFQRAGLAETLAGKIVLSIGAASGTDDEHFGNLTAAEYDRVKADLDELHFRKIDMADEILVLNVGGYIGDSTRREVIYAVSNNKPVRWLEPEPPAFLRKIMD
jgi:hypothetical protein